MNKLAVMMLIMFSMEIFLLAEPALSPNTNKSITPENISFSKERILVKYSSTSKIFKEIRQNGDTISKDKLSQLDKIGDKHNIIKTYQAYSRLKKDEMKSKLGIDRWYILEFPENSDVKAIAEEYKNDSNIEDVTLDYVVNLHTPTNDSYYPNQWGHKNEGQFPSYNPATNKHDGLLVGTVGFDSNVEEAYGYLSSYGSDEIVIAIIDTGVDLDHPDLVNNIIDGYDFGSNDDNPNDENGHGTSSAGIAVARANNGIGIAGVAGNCKIMPLKVSNQEGIMYFSAIQNALYYAVDNGADIVNMSLGNNSINSDPATDTALQYAYNSGLVLIASSGNDNNSSIEYPASNQYVIAVGAASPDGNRKSPTTADGESWWGSNYGSDLQDSRTSIEILAPTIIPTTDIIGNAGITTSNYNLYANGTSASAPFVAGVCGLIKSLHPTWTPDQIKQQLRISARDIAIGEASEGWDRFTGYGLVDAYQALIMDPPENYPPVFISIGPFTVPESSAEGTFVGNIDSNNGNGGGIDGDITYSITLNFNSDLDENQAFSINQTSGVIIVGDAGDLNFEDNPTINLTVRANDGFTSTDAEITIYLTPITANIIFVASDASGLNDGTSWTNAYTDLQSAFGSAVSGDSIFVKYGTYKPTIANGNRDISFSIPSGVAVLGHFAGTESSSWQRVLSNESYETILSGDLNGDDVEFDNKWENSKTIVMFYSSSSLTLMDGFTIAHGKSDNGGGAGISIYGGGGTNSSSPTIRNCSFEYNSGATYGGGIFANGYGSSVLSTPVIDNCRFYQNRSNLGGGICSSECSPIISNCYFELNLGTDGAAINHSSGCYGVGRAIIDNCVFYNNKSLGQWNTLINNVVTIDQGKALLENCLFEQNIPTFSGAVYCRISEVDIENCTFKENTPENDSTGGAAIRTEDGILNVKGCNFENNSVGSPGGAIHTTGTPLTVENSIFKGNTSGSWGGAIFTNGDNASITNCLFTGNNSGDDGGAICFNNNNSASVINCTISGNLAQSNGARDNHGGGIYSLNNNPIIKNSIIWGNDAETDGDDIYNSNSTPLISYSNIRDCGNSGDTWNSTFGSDEGNNISSYPYFIDYILPENCPNTLGDYRLLANSECLNAGNNGFISLEYDLDGNARIQNEAVDMGAYESSSVQISKVIFVNYTATGLNNGTDWTNAYTNLQDALANAISGDRIYVAKGTYKPDSGTNTRSLSFAIPSGVKVYGHFAGYESSFVFCDLSETSNETILSGDIGTIGIATDNSYHVVNFTNTSEETLLDRFTITDGYADNGTGNDSRGGAILFFNYGNPEINNCKMENCYAKIGGAVSIAINSLPVFNYCIFENNLALNFGGAVHLLSKCNAVFNYCQFIGNEVSAGSGGVIYNYLLSKIEMNYCEISGNSASQYGGTLFQNDSQCTMNNCIISGNFADNYGGAIRNIGSSSILNINNSTIACNSSALGGGALYNESGKTYINNSIIWGNSTEGNAISNINSGIISSSYSNIQGSGGSISWNASYGSDLGGNIDSDPKFKLLHPYSDAPTIKGDFDILIGSPCSDAGNNSLVHENVTLDMNGDDRIKNDVVDMGAYEGAKDRLKIYVSNTATGLNNGYNWEHAFNSIQDAISISASTDSIYVKYGTYKPVNTGRTSTFSVYNTNKLFGHFAGTETNSGERDLDNPAYETILSGDIGTVGVETDNCYHVVTYIAPTGGVGNTVLVNKVWMNGFTISDGYADGGGDNSLGGGIYNKTGFNYLQNELYLSNSKIMNNFAADGGAGICYNSSSPEGLVYNWRITGGAIDNCIIANNTTNGRGGGIYANASRGGLYRAELMNSTFSENASYEGGGIFINGNNGSFLDLSKIENCIIRDNTATNHGGGIYFDFQTNTSNPTPLTNSLITGNKSLNRNGGGVYYISSESIDVYPSTSYITNCTFSGNDSPTEGSALYNFDGNTLHVRNSIFWGNENPGSQIVSNSVENRAPWYTEDDWIITQEFTKIHFYNSNIETSGGSSVWNTNFCINEGNNIDSNPLFMDIEDNDYRITELSPCVNTGENSYNETIADIRGEERIQNTTIDMGAYEWSGILDSNIDKIFVKFDSTGDNDGSSWENAYTSLQTALNNVVAGVDIYVARGTYKPSSSNGLTNTPRNYHFRLKNSVKIFGGFAGTESSFLERTNFGFGEENETILSGDIGTEGINTDNCYHVIYNLPNTITNSAILDGVTVSGGNANLESNSELKRGGGMYMPQNSPIIRNVIFTDNYGIFGGAVFNMVSSGIYSNCLFFNNSAMYGGASMTYSSPALTFENCTFSENTAVSHGGGVDNWNSAFSYNNCIFWGNTSAAGNQIYAYGNSTITLNTSCYSSNANDIAVETGASIITTNNNITSNPIFVDTDNNDFRLYESSPCVDAGNNSYSSMDKDIRGQNRIQNTTIDMGCYEWTDGIDPASIVITFTNGLSFNAEVMNGSNNQAIGRFTLNSAALGCQFTAISVQISGEYNGLSNFKLWESTDNSFDFEEDTFVKSFEGKNSSKLGSKQTKFSKEIDKDTKSVMIFNNFSRNLPSENIYYFITCDALGSASGTIQASLADQTSLIISGGEINSTFTNASLSSNPIVLHPPEIELSVTTLPDFNEVLIHTNSPIQEYVVSGSYLLSDITISAPEGFLLSLGTEVKNEVLKSDMKIAETSSSILSKKSTFNTQKSKEYVSQLTISPINRVILPTAIKVVFSPTTDEDYIGNITHSALFATSKNISVSGTGVLNAPPTSENSETIFDEDNYYTYEIADFPFSDLDPEDQFKKIQISSLPNKGEFFLDLNNNSVVDLGEIITNNQIILTGDISKLKFRSDQNGNGAPYTSFTFRVNDGNYYSNVSYIMTINVNPINDAPVNTSNSTITPVGTIRIGGKIGATVGEWNDDKDNNQIEVKKKMNKQ
ncbi:MAG: S8 family serine peptidase [Candidatus Delongbacteria bacterium]|nr:S8 family serine peptidase [Candidatus Delongbacteria bacterium]MBN2833637.1 S8 family serine peptidase [Candidatus Delongbacteria bacterium]